MSVTNAATVRTSRFGVIEIAQDRVISFKNGLFGFPERTRFCLLEPGDDACFFWLQSVDDPDLALVVADPAMFVDGYSVPICPEQMGDIELSSLDDAQVFVVVNKVGGDLAGNLQAPLIVNTVSKLGEQIVLAEKRWGMRHVLVDAAGAAS